MVEKEEEGIGGFPPKTIFIQNVFFQKKSWAAAVDIDLSD